MAANNHWPEKLATARAALRAAIAAKGAAKVASAGEITRLEEEVRILEYAVKRVPNDYRRRDGKPWGDWRH